MSDKSAALAQIKTLMHQHQISFDDLKNTLSDPTAGKAGGVPRLFYYIGGIFIFAGIGVFTSMFWDVIGFGGQVMITLGVGFICYLMAVMSVKDSKYEKLSTPLFLISTFLQPTGILLVLDHYSDSSNAAGAVLFVSIVMLLQQIPTFINLKRGVLLFTSMAFYGFAISSSMDVFDILDGDLEWIGLALGISYISICSKLVQTPHHAVTPFWLFIGSAMLLTSGYQILDGFIFEIIFLGLSAGVVYLSTVLSSRTMLFNGTVSMLWYIGYFSYEFFEDSIGWPIVLVIVGLSCVGLVSYAMKLSRKMPS